jgi:hypothetical protein
MIAAAIVAGALAVALWTLAVVRDRRPPNRT